MRILAALGLAIAAAADVTPRGPDPRNQGHIWIVDQDGGTILQVDRKQGVLWSKTGLDRPRDLDVLPSGHIVVAGLDGRVVEIDRKGAIAWSYKGDEGLYAVRHLKHGNLLLGTFTRLIEVNRAGAVVWELKLTGKPQDVALHPNGNYLVSIYSGAVAEVDKAKGEVGRRSLPNMSMSIQHLPGDRVLIAEVAAQRVTEWDASGKLLREIKVPQNCPSAHRSRRGGTLISTWSRVYEIDEQGTTVWEGPKVSKCVRVREY